MALQFGTVAASIAALEIDGVDILDIIEIPTEAKKRDTPYIAPKPDGFISGFSVDRESFGPGTVAAFNVTYILTYRLYHSKIGIGRSFLFDTYSGMVAKVGLFLDAIIANDTISGAIDISPSNITSFGPVADPVGKGVFFGCDIGIEVMEFVN